jgi:hypothetical protein
MKFTRRTALAGLLAGVPKGWMGTAYASDAPESPKMRFGMIALTDCSPIIMAHELGYFKKFGIESVVSKEASWAVIRDKVNLGENQATHMLIGMPFASTMGLLGSPVRPMVIPWLLNRNGQAITLSNELEKQNIRLISKELKPTVLKAKADGKPMAFAMTFPPGTHAMWMRYCTAQATTTGQNVHGTRSVDVTVRCPTDTDGNGAVDQGGCADLKRFSNGSNFMSLYELDPGTTDDLIQTLYFPESLVSLTCTIFGCAPAQSPWVMPNAYDSPTSPAKVTAEFSMTVNSAVFVDSSRGCRVVGPALDTVSGASFRGPTVAPESIASAFGAGLAVSAENAVLLPLPVEMAGTRVSITDSAGATRAAPSSLFRPNKSISRYLQERR